MVLSAVLALPSLNVINVIRQMTSPPRQQGSVALILRCRLGDGQPSPGRTYLAIWLRAQLLDREGDASVRMT